MPRYRFGDFLLSPRRRMLLRQGREQPLIPRYLDLLIFLVERRHEAVHRRDIFDRVWSDVIVSDSALSQAIRTIRRTLGDGSREPRFIRTVSRHGYRFVFNDVIEEEDDGIWPVVETPSFAAGNPADRGEDSLESLLQRITRIAGDADEEEAQLDAAERLHGLGTSAALRHLGTRPGHAVARALLRDTRWESPGAGPVPILSQPAPLATSTALVAIRLRRGRRLVAARCLGASIGAGLAGALAGAAGGVILAAAPGSTAPLALAPVLATIGLACGVAAGAGVSLGLSIAEAIARGQRALAAAVGAAVGGGLIGLVVQSLGRWALLALVGLRIAIGGGLDGLVIGATAGLGYAIATPGIRGGMAAPRGKARWIVAALTAAACALGALGLTLSGRSLVGGTIHAIAQASQGAQATLTPFGRLLGEPEFGPLSRVLIGMGEGGLFGLGLALGLTRRTPSRGRTPISS